MLPQVIPECIAKRQIEASCDNVIVRQQFLIIREIFKFRRVANINININGKTEE